MHAEWKNYLESRNGIWHGSRVTGFGNLAQEFESVVAKNVVADLSHLGLISAQGPNVEEFLQGQFSNDVSQTSEQRSQLSSYCSPKGRMLAIFLLFRRENIFYLRLPRETLDSFLKRLGMFVLRAQVTLEDASDQLIRFGLSGASVADALQTLVGRVPQAPYDVVQQDAVTIVRIPGPQPRFELYGPLEAMQAYWETLAATCTPVGAGPWELLDILAGIPTIYPGTMDAFVPQMANLELIDGVNFKKGCYPGQEIVARTKYLGKLKRRMYLGRIQTEQPPQPGNELFPISGDTGQAAGKLVLAQPHPDGGYAALAVLKMSVVETGGVRVGEADGPTMELEELPYSLQPPED